MRPSDVQLTACTLFPDAPARRHIELVLLDSLDEIGLAIPERRGLDGGGTQGAEPLEAVTDTRDLPFARGDER